MNVILIIFDSLRKDAVGFFGGPSWGKIKTPNLDNFANECFVLPKCYPESLPTLPARRAIYTGCRVYPFEKNVYYKGDFKGSPGWGPIEEGRDTISEILKQNGYSTALISDVQHMFKPSKNFHRGFNQWDWVRGYEVDAYMRGAPPKKEEIDKYLPNEFQSDININFLSQCLANMQNIRHEEDYSVARVMRKAVKWLEQNYDNDKKFLTIEAWSPHEPWFVPMYYREMYSHDTPQNVLSLYCDTSNIPEEVITGTRANYSGLVTMCDRWFGYFLNCIKSMGILNDTLIIVTSDHGHSIGDNNYLGKRGYPSSPETIDSFLLLRHPNSSYGRGIVSDILIQHTDILPTILEILEVKPEMPDKEYQWSSMYKIPLDKQGKMVKPRNINLHGESFFKKLIDRDNKFRDHVTIGWGSAVTVINNRWWLNSRINGRGSFLYDLNIKNPFDNNLADKNPKIVKKLFSLALSDANVKIPGYLLEMANNQQDAPGCSALAAF